MTVSVQIHDFDLQREVDTLRASERNIGAIVTFSGLVRQNETGNLVALELEHYPDMTSKALNKIVKDANSKWDLQAVRVIHRVGRLELGEQIMMVATASRHRAEAFAAAEFLMDFLKSRAPFWKKEHTTDGTSWVDAKDSDENALTRWD